jgi:integrase
MRSTCWRSVLVCVENELLGLRWEDIDLESGTLEVVQTLQRVGGALHFVQPKTEDSARAIPLPPLCIDALHEHHRQQFTERADAWPDWQENGLVFPTRIGTPWSPTICGGAGAASVPQLG